MKIKYFTLVMILFVFISCNDDDECSDSDITITSLENEYGCIETKYQMEIELINDYTIIKNQSDFDSLVTGSCQPTIDFDMYDLAIGKKGLLSGNDTIAYDLEEDCESGDQTLTVTFNQNPTAQAPDLTYHALIPKLGNGQELTIVIEIID